MDGPVTHKPGHGGTQTGYRRERCRCAECRRWNTSSRQRERKIASKNSVRIDSVSDTPTVTVVSPASVTAIPHVSAQQLAQQDMTDILSCLDSDCDWRGVIDESASGEITALRSLIDSHNRLHKFPRIQYGVYEGNFWAGSPDETEVSVSHQTEDRQDATVQLPQRMPLAMPRDVQQVNSPTAPTTPETIGNLGSPTWG